MKPVLGRYFTAEDDRETAQGTLVLSYSLWQMEFGGDASVLGRKVLLDDKAMCKNMRCRKRFDVSGIKTTAFI